MPSSTLIRRASASSATTVAMMPLRSFRWALDMPLRSSSRQSMLLPKSSRQASRLLAVHLCRLMLPPCRLLRCSASSSRTFSSWWPLRATSAHRSTRARRLSRRDSAALDCAAIVNDFCPALVKRCWEEVLRTRRSHALRALHGNTPGATSSSTCWLASFNSDGLTAAGRWDTLLSYNYDILCLQETHLSVAKQQFFTSSTSLHCLWGSPVAGSSRCGVGMVVKAAKFAKVSSIYWPSDHPCHSFWATGRLQAALFYLYDNSAFVLYNMYGPAGARESSSPKRTLRQLLQRISEDAVSRALPAILVGDFNAESESNTYMQSLLATTWHDVADLSSGHKLHTCHKGSGSRIDHIWCSNSARSLCSSFSPFYRQRAQLFGSATQTSSRFTPRKACSFGHLVAPAEPFTCTMPVEFHLALRSKDVDTAASIWSRVAEQALLHLHFQQDGSSLRLGQPRGKIQFDSTRQLPRAQHDHADCLQLRRLGRAFRQASEVCKCGPGTRADRTWQNLQSILPACPPQWQSELSSCLQGRPGQDVARKVMHLLQVAMKFLQAERQSFRLKLWKQTMRGNPSKASSWRKTQELQVKNPLSA